MNMHNYTSVSDSIVQRFCASQMNRGTGSVHDDFLSADVADCWLLIADGFFLGL